MTPPVHRSLTQLMLAFLVILRLPLTDVLAGARRTEGKVALAKKELISYFGPRRARRVTRIVTTHFVIYTDGRAARGKFPKELEKTYRFIKRQLDAGEMKSRLLVLIFASQRGYHDFCVRQGWSRQDAEATAGHGSARYFATYYQSPRAAAVTHELAHAIFHRLFGPGGGSWLQEGVAVYVQKKYQRRSPARSFAWKLRAGEFVPLAEFFAMPKLIAGRDARGGARRATALYDQAGAFFEFLRRGPYAKAVRRALKKIAGGRRDPTRTVRLLEQLLGASVGEIQARWVRWGSKPPTS